MTSLYELQKKKDVDAVIRILRNSKSEAVRARAVEVLGEIGGEKAIRELINVVVGDDSEMVKSSAAKSIAWADEKALRMFLEKVEGVEVKGAAWVIVNYLLKALKSKDKNVRMHAAIALGRIGDDRAVPHLIEALEDKSPAVRRAASIALGMIGSSVAVDALVKRLKDEDVEVRKAALESLIDLGIGRKDIEAVKESLADPDPRVRELAATVLEKGGEAAVEPLW
jgi:HEAT repeat protein